MTSSELFPPAPQKTLYAIFQKAEMLVKKYTASLNVIFLMHRGLIKPQSVEMNTPVKGSIKPMFACDSHETNKQQLLNLERQHVSDILAKVSPLQREKRHKLCFPYGGHLPRSKQTYSSNVTPATSPLFAPLWAPHNHENDHYHGSSLRNRWPDRRTLPCWDSISQKPFT